MTSKSLAQLFADLGVTKSRPRPHVSNDNPLTESHFKTAKYGLMFPSYFANIYQTRDFCRRFFDCKTFIVAALPSEAKLGNALLEAWHAHPERFVLGTPRHRILNRLPALIALKNTKPFSEDWSHTYRPIPAARFTA